MMSWSAKLELMYMYDVQSQFENDRAPTTLQVAQATPVI